MKRALFRTSVVGAILGAGLLAIAHAQRPGYVPANPPQDDAANPLRGDTPPQASAPQANTDGLGPVDTASLPGDNNPLRRDLPQSSQRFPSRRAAQNAASSDVRLANNEEPVDSRYATRGMRPAGTEPQLMPANDRYQSSARTGNNGSMLQVRQTTANETIPNAPISREPMSHETAPHESVANGPRMITPDPSPQYIPGSTRTSSSFSPTTQYDQGQGGTGQPGNKALEGPQDARLVLQKIVPPEIQVGRPAILRTVVHNTGPAAAAEVEIHDQIPRGTRLLGTQPPASQGSHGELVWSLGTVKPGGEASVEMQIMPTDEGEIGSVATVRFQTEATARSIVTRPKLAIETAGANRVLLGDETQLTFTVSNPGSGVATGVTLVEHIPAGLKHPAGAELEYPVGDLKPGETRQLQLRLKAVEPGSITNVVTAKGDANLRAEHRFNLEVAAAKLDIALTGPKKRYLEREATYQFSVANPGTATAQQVELVAYLPTGLKFVSANNAGRYDANSRAVYWQMDELPINQRGNVELVTLPVQPGQYNLKIRGMAQRGLVSEKEQPVIVEGLASVLFQLSHTKDPVEIGGETTYEISVINQGSKAATNLQMAVFLPAELKPLAAEGPTRYTIEDNKVQFESLPQLAPKSVAAFRVRAQGLRAGDLRVRCQLMTDDMQRPVVKEESTRVYADE